jgi:hypothetical protein
MSKDTIEVDKILLQKIAEFTNIVLSEIKSLREQVNNNLQKEAGADLKKEKYQTAVQKVAKALYDSDLDFITGDFDQRKFIKLAIEDPSYMARMFEKVCNAADVSLIGKPARVATIKKKAEYDPVYARAFGQTADYDSVFWEE